MSNAAAVFDELTGVGSITSRGAVLPETPSATNPTVVPSYADLDTGIGLTASDVPSIIAGGVSVASMPANAVAVAVGAVAGSGIAATEWFVGPQHQTTLTLTSRAFAVTDALAYAGSKLYDFPVGRILIQGATASLVWTVTSDPTTTINTNAAFDWALGSATASNVTLATTMVDLLPKVDLTLAAAQNVANTASTGALAASAQFDGTATALDLYLNGSFPTTTEIDADGTMTVSGTITVTWFQLGDY